MSVFDAAPPNTHAGGNDDALRPKGVLPMNPTPAEPVDDRVDMEEYTKTVPWWKRVHRHSLTQMLLLSIQATCGPAMSDAIAGEYQSSERYRVSILMASRAWWWWSGHSSDIQHLVRSSIRIHSHIMMQLTRYAAQR